MKVAAVIVEDWKLPTYEKRLQEASYRYENKGAFTPGVTILHVHCENEFALSLLLQQCQIECRSLPNAG